MHEGSEKFLGSHIIIVKGNVKGKKRFWGIARNATQEAKAYVALVR